MVPTEITPEQFVVLANEQKFILRPNNGRHVTLQEVFYDFMQRNPDALSNLDLDALQEKVGAYYSEALDWDTFMAGGSWDEKVFYWEDAGGWVLA